MIELPSNTEAGYLDAFGVVALFVATTPTNAPCLIGYTPDLTKTIEGVRERWYWSVDYATAWWMRDREQAKQIIADVNTRLPVDARGLFDAEAQAVCDLVERAAARLRIPVTPHDHALSRVRAALARVDNVIEGANASGELGWFNRAYRKRRQGEGPMAMTYGQARTLLRAAVVRRIASGTGTELGMDLIAELFPEQKPAAHALGDADPMPHSPPKRRRMGSLPTGKAGHVVER